MEVDVWTAAGKKSVLIEDCLLITAVQADFYVRCHNDIYGEISIETMYDIFEVKPEIIDEKALELRKTRERIRAMFKDI